MLVVTLDISELYWKIENNVNNIARSLACQFLA